MGFSAPPARLPTGGFVSPPCDAEQVALIPDTLQAGELELRRWSAAYVDEFLQAIAASFSELHRWMPWAQTMPNRNHLWEALEAAVRCLTQILNGTT
jgi:hypothetical protein